MGPRRIRLLALVFLLVAISTPTSVVAFHDQGAAACSACHIMHESEDGGNFPTSGQPLLRAATATDVCLACHADQNGAVFGINPVLPPPERGPGNFVFLLEDNLNDGADGFIDPIPGERAGHSVISIDRGVGQDSHWSMAPGGTFPSSELGCTSCHDPHGNENYRMLYGVGEVQGGLAWFGNPAPVAVGLSLDAGTPPEGIGNHVAYRSGMSEWCSNCHGLYRHREGDWRSHPTDKYFSSKSIDHYNLYNGDADPTGGSAATSYLSEVPFEGPSATIGSTQGPTTQDRLTCLSCHRAHASSAMAAGRWDFTVQYLDEDGAISGSYPIPNPYPDPSQGQLCVKCHDRTLNFGAPANPELYDPTLNP